jgi:hypothetical protein
MADRSNYDPADSSSADESGARDPRELQKAQLRQDPELQQGLTLNENLRYAFIRSLLDPNRILPVIYTSREAIADDKVFAICEADIILGEVAILTAVTNDILNAESGTRIGGDAQAAVAITGERFRWYQGRIPYRIDPGLPNTARVSQAINHWHQRSGGLIRFEPRAAGDENFVTFRRGQGCASSVGMISGEQFIELAESCSVGNVIHEIGHTVGLWHEQSREDRDQHVTILWQNIKPEMLHNFFQHITDGDDIGAYDYGSIMHYNATAFTRNGAPTIQTPNGEAIGQRVGLSEGDIAAVRALYAGRAVVPAPAPAPVPSSGSSSSFEAMLARLMEAFRLAMDEVEHQPRDAGVAAGPASRVSNKIGAARA